MEIKVKSELMIDGFMEHTNQNSASGNSTIL